ncbi:MAG: homoserine O-succinyltransferase [Gammaproteobacteria bacterium]|nr:homoserine O-succinyltransferase [Gammaproteobacteria bacterium]
MNILFITHADFEQPGYFETWAQKHGYDVEIKKPYKNEQLPDVTTFDCLIIMGGPQSPLEIDKAPYLNQEIQLIKQAIAKDYPIIGVCLGAQLIGEALGAKTERSPFKEIGMYPIRILNREKEGSISTNLPDKFEVMHWHSDMPGLTANSIILAESDGCPRQIVKYDEQIYGFQCHLELTKDLVEGLIANCPNDLKSGRYINTVEELRKVDYDEINHKLDLFLENIKELICANQPNRIKMR